MRRTALTALAFAALLPAAAGAHPHVFIDAEAAFGFDDGGRLATVTVSWRYDAFYTLLLLETVEADADGDGALTDEDRRKLVEAFSIWEPGWHGDAFLSVDGAGVGLSDPVEITADMRDGRVEMRFRRTLAEPAGTGPLAARLKIYDPTYFVAYDVVGEPALVNAPEGCVAAVAAPERTERLASLEASLAELPPDATPEQEGVGALFADRIELRCPAASR